MKKTIYIDNYSMDVEFRYNGIYRPIHIIRRKDAKKEKCLSSPKRKRFSPDLKYGKDIIKICLSEKEVLNYLHYLIERDISTVI